MNFYDQPENVDKYIEMCEGYDGTHLYQLLAEHLKQGQSLLEIGCGAGTDIGELKKHYRVIGSDRSIEFIKRCKLKHPEIDFLQLNAIDIALDAQVDCIYSNKVLHHLKETELKQSLKRQSELLKSNGLIAHSFWLGEGSETIDGMFFQYYAKHEIIKLLSQYFEVIESYCYQEFDKDDSIFIIARKKYIDSIL